MEIRVKPKNELKRSFYQKINGYTNSENKNRPESAINTNINEEKFILKSFEVKYARALLK